jgi:hypothetical protein
MRSFVNAGLNLAYDVVGDGFPVVLQRNYALLTAGVMPIVCPVADGSGVIGVSIFDADPAEVEKIMAGDPGVQAGVFIYDIHSTRSFPGSALP